MPANTELATNPSDAFAHALGFRTQERELSLERLPVEGRLPPWLRCTWLRNGPAKFEMV